MSSDYRPFILLANSRLEDYRGQAEYVLATWNKSWFEDSLQALHVAVEPFAVPSDARFDKESVWWRLETDQGNIYLHLNGFQANDFFQLMLDLPSVTASSKSSKETNWEIIKELLADFIHQWMQIDYLNGAVAKTNWSQSVVPRAFFERGSGALLLTIARDTAQISFAVPFAMLPPSVANNKFTDVQSKRSVFKISDVLGHESTRLFVEIDAMEKVPLDALSNLNVGDVILLSRKVQEPLNLVGANGAHIGGCHIGRHGESRAIHIAAPFATGTFNGIPSKS